MVLSTYSCPGRHDFRLPNEHVTNVANDDISANTIADIVPCRPENLSRHVCIDHLPITAPCPAYVLHTKSG
ncbi:hypothetical protein GCM10008020_28870 [Massilia psychrophila]|nr:hypothetical protein GCM10008020_28870 [Massilia psychrophila]